MSPQRELCDPEYVLGFAALEGNIQEDSEAFSLDDERS